MQSKYNVRQRTVLLHHVSVLKTANLELAGIGDESSRSEDRAYRYRVSANFF